MSCQGPASAALFLTAILIASSICTPAVALAPHAAALARGKASRALTQNDNTEHGMSFITHHKTGTGFSMQVTQCLRQEATFMDVTDGNQQEWLDPQRGKMVYMVRNPYEMARSSYLYAMGFQEDPMFFSGEAWLRKPLQNMIKNTSALLEPVLPNESYNNYIHRVNLSGGVLAEMTGLYGINERHMNEGYLLAQDDERILIVCLDEVFSDFNGTMQSILKHFGIAPSEETRRCLAKVDPSANSSGYLRHSTHEVDGDMRDEVMRLVREHDAKYFGGRFGHDAVARRCANAEGTDLLQLEQLA